MVAPRRSLQEDDPAAIVEAVERRATRMDTAVTGGGTIVWRIWGSGDPVVLGHGSQGAWPHWIRSIDALSAGRMVIVPDLPGHGDSSLPPCEDHEGFTAVLADGLQQILPLGTRADVVGFSLGGIILAHMAAGHPELVRRMVLVGTGGLGTPLGDIRRARLGERQGEERTRVLTANLLGMMLHHPESVDALALHLLVRDAHRCRIARAARAALVMPDRLLRVLPLLPRQLAAIWGEFDRPHPHPRAQEAVLRSFDAELDFRVVPGAGHWAMYERPEAFNAILLDMLAGRGADRSYSSLERRDSSRSSKSG